MLAVYCRRCRRPTLVSLDDVTDLRHTATGLEVHYRCAASHAGVWAASRRIPRPT